MWYGNITCKAVCSHDNSGNNKGGGLEDVEDRVKKSYVCPLGGPGRMK
jgi:hypothetical protein